MRLRPKLVLLATALTFALVLVLSAVFLGELLRQRVEQTTANNEVLANEVLLASRHAVETGLIAHPPVDETPQALQAAVTDALRDNVALGEMMSGILRYSPTVQDVYVANAQGLTLTSTDLEAQGQMAPVRASLNRVQVGSVFQQTREVFGPPRVLDVSVPLNRNGQPFLVIHVGVRSSFLKESYTPWLSTGMWIALFAAIAAMLAAGLIATLALRPLEAIGDRLEQITAGGQGSVHEVPERTLSPGGSARALISGTSRLATGGSDALERVSRTIDRLGQKMLTTEAGYTALQTNVEQILETLRDGVMLFNAERRVAIASDSMEKFFVAPEMRQDRKAEPPPAWRADPQQMVGKRLEEIFDVSTVLGAAVLRAFDRGDDVVRERLTLEDGRELELELDGIPQAPGLGYGLGYGTLLTLRDRESAMRLEHELEVSRRLAEIGRLTAGVGHEVKNPINAMVLHLELLRGKLARMAAEGGSAMNGNGVTLSDGAQRHVEILASEMARLDRVVQTLADFSRPMEMKLDEHDLRSIVLSVAELADAEMDARGVETELDLPKSGVEVHADAELLRQALLNLVLNGMQAMPNGGQMRITVRREGKIAVVEIADTGEGISPELLPRIFELYFTTKKAGSGIGLAMTYRIVQLHGGEIKVHSEADPKAPARGTVFTMRLPVMTAAARSSRQMAMHGVALLIAMSLSLGLSGCRHKAVAAVLPAPTPAPLVASAPVTAAIPLEQVPVSAPEPEVTVRRVHVRHKVKKPVVEVATAPVVDQPVTPPQAPATPSSASAIGQLSSGNEIGPEVRQQAQELIVTVQKRVDGISTQLANTAKSSLGRVRGFLGQAQDALQSGDAAGARTLAVKAKVLMDDLEKAD